MAGLGVVICSYNMLGIQMHVGQTKQILKVRSKKIRTQHNYKKSDVHGSQATKPNGRHYTVMWVAAQYYQYTW